MKNRSFLNSPRILELKKEKHKVLLIKISLSFLLLLLLLIGLIFLSRWKKLNINDIQVSGNSVTNTTDIDAIISQNLTGYYFWVFPKTNFLLYPKKEIVKKLANTFKRLKDISLSVRNLQTLNVSLTERNRLYTYCGTTSNLSAELANQIPAQTETCYFLDENGYIFDQTPYFSGGVYTKFYGTVSINNSDPSGSYFFSPNFNKLITLKDELEEIELKPVAFYVEDDGDIEVFLTPPQGSQLGPEIILNKDSDFDEVVENLESVLTTEPLQSEFASKYASLLYIDLRFGNKVYYKFK
jgi:hypothetical protein